MASKPAAAPELPYLVIDPNGNSIGFASLGEANDFAKAGALEDGKMPFYVYSCEAVWQAELTATQTWRARTAG